MAAASKMPGRTPKLKSVTLPTGSVLPVTNECGFRNARIFQAAGARLLADWRRPYPERIGKYNKHWKLQQA
jgi:hypothetical protein